MSEDLGGSVQHGTLNQGQGDRPVTPYVKRASDIEAERAAGFRMVGDQAPLFAALAAARATFAPILKTRTNPFFNSKYADLSDVLDACMPALTAQGLYLCQIPTAPNRGEDWVIYSLLTHASGAFWEWSFTMPRAKWQEFGSAMTYARRYIDSAVFGVASEPDDDGNDADEKGPSPRGNGRPTPPAVKPQAAKPAEPKPAANGVTAPAQAVPAAVAAPTTEERAEQIATRAKSTPPPAPGPIAQAVSEAMSGMPMTQETHLAIKSVLKPLGYDRHSAPVRITGIVSKGSQDMTEADGLLVLNTLRAEAEQKGIQL